MKMTRSELVELFEEFLQLTDRQQLLREELLQLQMFGKRATEERVAAQMEEQQAKLDEIERIRMQLMLPILEKLAAFIASVRPTSAAASS
ncbi:hypothetical protein JST97_28235 [bacterium]|nr:hypothetical protein [bacterium]